jgi:hypothetical protein
MSPLAEALPITYFDIIINMRKFIIKINPFIAHKNKFKLFLWVLGKYIVKLICHLVFDVYSFASL